MTKRLTINFFLKKKLPPKYLQLKWTLKTKLYLCYYSVTDIVIVVAFVQVTVIAAAVATVTVIVTKYFNIKILIQKRGVWSRISYLLYQIMKNCKVLGGGAANFCRYMQV